METQNTNNKNRDWALIAVIVVFIIALFAVSVYKNSSDSETEITNQGESVVDQIQREKDQVSLVVLEFGLHLQNVSLLAPEEDLRASMDEHYSKYLTEELLESWKNNPDIALGRKTSSPWPERIEIEDISGNTDGSYVVDGRVIEVTSVEEGRGGEASSYSVQLRVVETIDGWKIDKVN